MPRASVGSQRPVIAAMPRIAVIALSASLCLARQVGAQEWSAGDLRVNVADKQLTIATADRTLVRTARLRFGLLDPVDVRVQASTPERLTIAYTFPSAAEAIGGQAVGAIGPGSELPLRVDVVITPVTGGIRLYGDARWARHLAIVMDDLGDHAFGLIEWLYPDNRPSPDLRGQVINLDIEGQASRLMENYANAASAFYISSLGNGSFFDTFARGRYTFGIGGRHEIYHETGTLDWYLFHGADGVAIHRGYFAVIGAPKHVPMWALGPIAWRDENRGGKDEVLADAEQFTALRIPLTAMWIDRPYSNGTNGWSAMDFNANFADPGTWIATLRQRYGLELMTWAASQVFSADDAFPGLFRSPAGYFDLTDSAAVAEFGRRLSTGQYAFGVRGHKLDRADQTFPIYQQWQDRTPAEAQRNKYPYLFAHAAHQFLTKAWGHDQFTFARGAYHRSQPYLSAVWGGDSRSSWNGMALNLANGIRTQFLGFPVFGSDVGGYLGQGRIPEALYARWLQLGAWSGMFEVKLDGSGGSGEDRPPWKYSERLQNIYRELATQRMRLLPTLYSLANTSATNGVLMQPLAYAFPADTTTYAIADEYLFGGRFLVAPILTPGDTRYVYLPRGRWLELANAARVHEGGQRISVTAPLEQVPVFVRAGSVYVEGDVFAGNSARWIPDFERHRRLVIRAYPDASITESSFDYVDALDGDSVKTIVMKATTTGLTLAAPALALGGEVEIVLARTARQVRSGGRNVAVRYDAASGVLRVPFSARRAIAIEVGY